jgi:hypothetical protein
LLTIYESAVEDARKFARDADDMIQRWMPGIEAPLQECMKKGLIGVRAHKAVRLCQAGGDHADGDLE